MPCRRPTEGDFNFNLDWEELEERTKRNFAIFTRFYVLTPENQLYVRAIWHHYKRRGS
jgi:hypothetical protein